jgi:2-polyprenyl-3-methyl-5-hydroxy-6-metoxy-1,4-benzoquinol methylase
MVMMPDISRFTQEQLETLAACPWCKDSSPLPMFVEKGFPYVQCQKCELIYLQTRVRQEHLGAVYGEDYHSQVDARYAWRNGEKRLDLLGALPSGARIHEDAAGSGAFVAVCQQRGFHCTGNDLGVGSIKTAKDMFGVALTHGTVADAELKPGSLDVFAAFNLLSHLYEPWNYFRSVAELLSPTGVLLLRTGNRVGHFRTFQWGRWSAPEHVFHYTISTIRDMMRASGLEIVRMVPAFDSDYPYFMSKQAEDGSLHPVVRRTARRCWSLSVLTWNYLRLPKDDVFIIASRSKSNGNR